MHTRDRLGLSLDYWQEKRRIGGKTSEKTWSILVDCAPLPALGYLPIRVSENWLSANIQKADPPAEDLLLSPEHGPILDWLEPENTLLPSTDPPKPDAMEGVEQAVDLRAGQAEHGIDAMCHKAVDDGFTTRRYAHCTFQSDSKEFRRRRRCAGCRRPRPRLR